MNFVASKISLKAANSVRSVGMAQQYVTTRRLSAISWINTPYQWMSQLFLLLVLLSALAIVMETSKTRHDYRQLQVYQQQIGAAQLQRGRLLLEQSTLLTQARIVQVAGEQSLMAMPLQKMLVVVTE